MDELDRALKVVAAADQREVLRRGWHLVKRHFYTPLNDPEWLEQNRDLWQKGSVPRDIEWDIEGQMRVAAEVGEFVEELRDVPVEEPGERDERGKVIGPATYHWKNNFFSTADALVWYGLVRSRRPRRVVEVGCGWSSLLLKRAIEANVRGGRGKQEAVATRWSEDSSSCPLPVQGHGERGETRVTQIEPYPNERVFAALPGEWERHRVVVQRAPMSVFEELGRGDVLFYDGSHCSRVASDVNWMVFRVLPRLARGVLIHFHDLFWPREYPKAWLFDRLQTWNEQYVLQALLMNSRAYRVVIANGMLDAVRGPEVERLYRGVQKPGGGSVWIEKMEGPTAEGDRRWSALQDEVEGLERERWRTRTAAGG